MSYEAIAILMFASMLLMLLTGQRVFAAIGFVSAAAALLLWGDGAVEMPFNAAFKLFNWYPLLTLPLFIYMGYVLSESGIANDLYRMFHVWFGGLKGGLAVGTIGLMVVISAMNGLSVAGMAIGATIALPEMLRRGYDKIMITGVVQAGSSLGILVPPSVVLGTDVFDQFLERNDLRDFAIGCTSDAAIERRFLSASFPEEAMDDLAAFLKEARYPLAVRSSGAYGFTMSSNYNTRPRAAEIMVDGDNFHVVRERESLASLYAGEQVLPE